MKAAQPLRIDHALPIFVAPAGGSDKNLRHRFGFYFTESRAGLKTRPFPSRFEPGGGTDRLIRGRNCGI